MSRNILVIEDDRQTADWIRIYLERAGFSAEPALCAREARALFREHTYDLILLDLMLPDGDGKEMCSEFRRESEIPIIMLTARSARSDRLQGLSGGADDYITKPFDPDELVLRIKAVLRRTSGSIMERLSCGPMILDQREGLFTLFGETVRLSTIQREIMAALMGHANCILSRQQLIDMAYRREFDGYDRAVDTQIQRLRHLIHRDGFKPIETVYGEGYRLVWRDD